MRVCPGAVKLTPKTGTRRGAIITNQWVIIAGGGIGGLSLALTLHQIGMPFLLYEAVSDLRPLGVGINIQPNAVRELLDMGISAEDLNAVGVPVREWALVGQNGHQIYAEPRGTFAGYDWPQYAVHRGEFQMLLYRHLCAVAGADAVQLGHRVTGYETHAGGVTALIERTDGCVIRDDASLLIAAGGIHSALRAQMHPDQLPIHWGGAIMWRGTTQAKPIRTGSSFVGLGTHRHRMVIYPISPPDPDTGLATINWIAEVTVDDLDARDQIGWLRQVETSEFAHHFADWQYDWLDVPALIDGASVAYENPMIDRDPVDTWRDGPVVLMGDAAHAMYPTGSNGASQAIIDARVLGQCLLAHGVTPDALAAYDAQLCAPLSWRPISPPPGSPWTR